MAELIDKGALRRKLLENQVTLYYDNMEKREVIGETVAILDNLPTVTEAEIRAKAKRELAEQIEKRIKEEVALLVSEREEAREYDDEQVIFAVNNQLRAFDYSLRVVAEQLKGE